MTIEEKVTQYGCSIQGYLKYMKDNNYNNVMDAINGSIKYLLRNGIDEELTDCSRNELIYVIKNEIAKMVAKQQLDNNANDLTNMHSENEKDIQQFLNNPLNYIGTTLKEKEKDFKIDRTNINNEEDDRLARKYNKNIKDLSRLLVIEGVKTVYDVYENHQQEDKAYHTMNQLKVSLPNNSIEESFVKQQPGFFEKFFRTTSKEYNDFKQAFGEYNDKNSIYSGNDEYLKNAAMGYIHHKFPGLKANELPTREQIAALSGASKERASFCLDVINVINQNSALQQQADKITEALSNADIVKQNNNISDDVFHKDLKEDVNDLNKENKIDMEISADYIKENSMESSN